GFKPPDQRHDNINLRITYHFSPVCGFSHPLTDPGKVLLEYTSRTDHPEIKLAAETPLDLTLVFQQYLQRTRADCSEPDDADPHGATRRRQERRRSRRSSTRLLSHLNLSAQDSGISLCSD